MTHRRNRSNVVTWNAFERIANNDNSWPSDDLVLHDNLILAEGDSWFTLGGIPTSNLLFSMRFRKRTMIVNCGMPGDTIKNISKIIKNQNLKNAFKSSYSKPWKLMFMSGGGNDLIDEAGNIIKKRKARKQKAYNDVAKYCDDKKLQKLLSNISSGYKKITKLRDGPNSKAKNIPIITHTYAYPTPRNSPATFLSAPLSGPWLYKVMVQAKIPEEHWLPLTDYLFNNLADTIADLKNTLPNFHVVDTRDLLSRAKLGVTGNSYDWMNEIHPNSGGYRKIARELDALADNFL